MSTSRTAAWGAPWRWPLTRRGGGLGTLASSDWLDGRQWWWTGWRHVAIVTCSCGPMITGRTRFRVLPKRVRPSDHTSTATLRRPAHHRRRSIQPFRRRARSHYTAVARHWPPPRAPITPCARLEPWLTVARTVDSHYHHPPNRAHGSQPTTRRARAATPTPTHGQHRPTHTHGRDDRPAAAAGEEDGPVHPRAGTERDGRRRKAQTFDPRGHAAHTTVVEGHGPGRYARGSGTQTGMGGAPEGEKKGATA